MPEIITGNQHRVLVVFACIRGATVVESVV